jgi:HPt (histidine-containing phosphotransfer) domain-containing protein
LVRASHSLKSAADLFAARPVSLAAEEIEKSARAGSMENIHQKFASLRDACRIMLDEIEGWLQARTAS